MIISDLNYCEAVTEGLDKVAGGFGKKFHFSKVVITTFGKPIGNIAKATADAGAAGHGSFTQTATFTETVQNKYSVSGSSSTSVS